MKLHGKLDKMQCVLNKNPLCHIRPVSIFDKITDLSDRVEVTDKIYM